MRAAVLGALIGGLLATWLAPKAIAWYFDPPVSFGVTCKAPIEWALRRLQWSQLIGIIAGGTAGLVLYFLVFKRKKEPLPPENI